MDQAGPTLQSLPLDLIDPGPADDQRAAVDPEELRALADSILREGLIQPIVVGRRGERYITIAGRRRREACRLAGLTQIDAIVHESLADQRYTAAIAENLHRSNLSPIEEAITIMHATADNGLTIEQVAHAFGRSAGWVRDRMALLTWPQDVIDAVHGRELSVAAAAPLATIEREDVRGALVEEAVKHGATARVTHLWARTAHATGQAITDQPTAPGEDAPPAAPVIPVQKCWCCKSPHPMTALQHLPTCTDCYELVPDALRHAFTPASPSSAPTAETTSESSTPM